jgi:hypothetical protein
MTAYLQNQCIMQCNVAIILDPKISILKNYFNISTFLITISLKNDTNSTWYRSTLTSSEYHSMLYIIVDIKKKFASIFPLI